MTVEVEIKGLARILEALRRFPREVLQAFEGAGREAGNEILDTTGLRAYPPAYHAPQPFKSDQQRRGFFAALQAGEIEVPYRRGLSPRSERYGTQFYVLPQGAETKIGNRASYAGWLAGERQSAYMAAGGWRKLADVAREKLDVVGRIYEAWITRTLRNLGL